MTSRFLYIKFVGFLLVILGFSYCLTSFYNFYDYIFGNNFIANANIVVMSLGLIFPLYMFIFGVYFYLYADKNVTKINKFIFTSAIAFFLCGLACLFFKNNLVYKYLFFFAQIGEFLHISIGYISMVLGLLIIYGCLKYKY